MKKYITIRKTSIRISSLIALALILSLSTVLALTLWNKTLPSTVTLTATSNAELYNEVGCTTVATTVIFPSFDRLDLTEKHSNHIWLKYTGSKVATMYLNVMNTTAIPTGFTVTWVKSGGTAHDLGVSESIAFTTGLVVEMYINIQQTVAHTEGSYTFSFDFRIQDTA